jgi:hypothetical protein
MTNPVGSVSSISCREVAAATVAAPRWFTSLGIVFFFMRSTYLSDKPIWLAPFLN